ncbi:MAG: response regulator [Cyclobacteriaceae bacterium]
MDTKVLICDDDQDLLEMTSIVLKKDNCIVEPYSEMTTIMKKVINFMPDVILMDLSMPEVDGFEATSMIRGSDKTSHIPIVLFSANPKLKEYAEQLKTQYLAKPFDISELRNIVKSCVLKL